MGEIDIDLLLLLQKLVLLLHLQFWAAKSHISGAAPKQQLGPGGALKATRVRCAVHGSEAKKAQSQTYHCESARRKLFFASKAHGGGAGVGAGRVQKGSRHARDNTHRLPPAARGYHLFFLLTFTTLKPALRARRRTFASMSSQSSNVLPW